MPNIKLQKNQSLKDQDSPKNLKDYLYFRFVRIYILAAAVPMLTIGLVNWAFDPYGVFDTASVENFNDSKPQMRNHSRMFKAVAITRLHPKAILLGSSRVDYGMNPQHEVFDPYPNAYNLGISASGLYELRRYLEHALVNQPNLELVAIGLDEFMFNEWNPENPGFSESRLEIEHIAISDLVQTLLSFDVFSDSLETFKTSRDEDALVTYSDRGQLQLRKIELDPATIRSRFEFSVGFYFKMFPQSYEISQTALSELKKIVEICQENDIELKLFISPPHALQSEALRAAGHWEAYEQMKREIVKITPLWDFSGYNTITIEPVNTDLQNYSDSSHYVSRIGDLILDKIFNRPNPKIPEDFGVWVTPQNIEQHLAKTRRDREAWVQTHPDEAKWVVNLKESADTTP